jgi:glycogen debranching enzyme
LGCIPNNVDSRTLQTNFQAYADSGLWFVIGNAALFKTTKNISFLKKNYPAIKKTLLWYHYQDVDQTGLISIQEGTDWEDLFAIRGKGLYVNVLYYLALREAARMAGYLKDNRNESFYRKMAKDLRYRINKKFWYEGNQNILYCLKMGFGSEGVNKENFDRLGRKHIFPKKTILKKDCYYLPYLTFRDIGEWFDSFGNLLAIISGVADRKKAKIILKFIEKHKLAKPYPIRAIYPPILPDKKDWRYYYKFGNLNLPHQYHNGGIWPFLGGFYITALIKMKEYEKAKKALLSLTLLNKKGRYLSFEFNEWFHGKNLKPMGMAKQAWSAGMYIYSCEAINKKRVLFFAGQ